MKLRPLMGPGRRSQLGHLLLSVRRGYLRRRGGGAPPAPSAPSIFGQSITVAEDGSYAGQVGATQSPTSYAAASQPSHGALSLNTSTGAFTYTPTANYNGSDSFTVTATNGLGTSATATISITVSSVNDAPVSAGQTWTTNVDTAATRTLAATDVDSGSLTYTILSGPSHGAISGFNASTGAFTYTPASTYSGPDSFTWQATDGALTTAVATETITVSSSPSTNTYTLAQSDAWTLQRSMTLDAPNLRGVATGRNSRATEWTGYITGTDAAINANSDFGQNGGLIEVSIDGGAFVAQNASGGFYPIFSGLSHARRLVALRFGAAYSTAPWIPGTGTVLSVTGVPPSIEIPTFVQPGDSSLAATLGNSLVAMESNYLPAKYVNDDSFWVGANNPSMRLRCDYTTLVMACFGRYVGYTVDTGAPTFIDRGAVGWGVVSITGLSGTHTYNVWSSEGSMMTLGGLGGSTGLSSFTKKYLPQFGDSITEGAAASSRAHTDTFRVAAALGYCGQNFGKSGDQIQDLYNRLTNGSSPLLSGLTVTSSDATVLAIGRNNVTAWDWAGTMGSNYRSSVSALLTKGFGKVVCRGILPDGSTGPWTSQNNDIASYVSGLGDSRVVYCNTDSWTDIAYPGGSDFTHPTDAGYITLAGHAQTAYAALGL